MVLYLGTLLMLASLMVIGANIAGSVRWIVIGPFFFQPSEIAKITITIALAAFISERHDEMDRPINYLISIALVALPMGLVFCSLISAPPAYLPRSGSRCWPCRPHACSI